MAKKKGKIIRLKKRRLIGRRELIVIAAAIILTVGGIKAADNFMGGDKTAEKAAGRCPDDMIFITSAAGGFCLDKFEASPGGECPTADPGSQTATLNNLDTPA